MTRQWLRALPHACLLVLLAPCSAFAQAATDPPTSATSEPKAEAVAPRFEIGLHGAAAPKTRDQATQWFAGLSAAYAIRPWFALGTEVDALRKVGIGADTATYLRETQPHYIMRGYQALILGELRLPLVHDVVRPFVRAAVGPANVTHADSSTAMVVATRASLGVDLHLGHFYARPFGFVGTIATEGPQLGFGLEAGATF